MLLLQHKNTRDTHRFFMAACALSLLAHLVYVGIGLLYTGSTKSTFTIRSAAQYKTHVVVICPTQKKTEALHAARPVLAPDAATTSLIPVPVSVPKKSIQHQPKPKSVVAKKPAVAVKKPVQPVLKKPVAVPVPQKEPVKPVVAKSGVDTSAPARQVIAPERLEVTYADARALYQQQELEKEVASRWRPPHGISQDTVCSVKAVIDGKGNVVSASIERSSGILMYDVAARSTVFACKFPQWAWATTKVIEFKP